jgi:hypothetical protein
MFARRGTLPWRCRAGPPASFHMKARDSSATNINGSFSGRDLETFLEAVAGSMIFPLSLPAALD